MWIRSKHGFTKMELAIQVEVEDNMSAKLDYGVKFILLSKE